MLDFEVLMCWTTYFFSSWRLWPEARRQQNCCNRHNSNQLKLFFVSPYWSFHDQPLNKVTLKIKEEE